MTPPINVSNLSDSSQKKPILRALARMSCRRPPFWFMRQAGRYLPEYRQVRRQAGSFLDLCFSPELAAEVTMQPVRRFGTDAAILFSDILVVPHALGQTVSFTERGGPRLEPVASAEAVARLGSEDLEPRLAPVYETIRRVRAELAERVALIGFAGAPWTVACYMVEGGSSQDFASAKAWAYGEPGTFQRLIELLVEATSRHLLAQTSAGAEVLQLFDSWAGVLAEDQFDRWVVEPTREIVRLVRAARPDVPIIGFPRGAGPSYPKYVARTGVEGVGIDTSIPLRWAAEKLQPHAAVQGNLDPALLLAGGATLGRDTERILRALSPGPFIFNLGHGILPETPPHHVAALADMVRAWQS